MSKGNIFKVSQSKINLWRKCKYAYYLRFIENLRRRIKPRPLQFGIMVHDMIEADANGDDPMKSLNKSIKGAPKMFAAEREDFIGIVSDVRAIMTDYFEFWKDDPIMYLRRKGRGAEHWFEVDMADGILLTGKLDAMGLTKDKRKWLIENKSFNQMPSEDHRWRNLQSNIYFKVLDILGIEGVSGILWNYIRSKGPGVPQIMKDGTLSRKRLNSLPTRLRAFMKERGFKEKDYKRLIEAAEANRRNYFARERTSIKPRVVEAVWKDAIETAVEMRENHGIKRAKTIDRHCEWCEFEPLCRAELTGGDTKSIRSREFYVHGKAKQSENVIEAVD